MKKPQLENNSSIVCCWLSFAYALSLPNIRCWINDVPVEATTLFIKAVSCEYKSSASDFLCVNNNNYVQSLFFE